MSYLFKHALKAEPRLLDGVRGEVTVAVHGHHGGGEAESPESQLALGRPQRIVHQHDRLVDAVLVAELGVEQRLVAVRPKRSTLVPGQDKYSSTWWIGQ